MAPHFFFGDLHMSKPCYLSLSSDGGVLTDMEDIIPSVLRTFFGQPGNTSDIVDQYKESFKMIDAKSGTDPYLMSSAVSSALKRIYDRYFPKNNVDVICKPEIISEARYNLLISVVGMDTSGRQVNLISNRKISVNRETQEFRINFGNNANATIKLSSEEY